MLNKINLSFKFSIVSYCNSNSYLFYNFWSISLNYVNLNLNFLYADFASYSDFDFSSLKLILSQHRTFGFPLLKIYRFFDYELIFGQNLFIFCTLFQIYFYFMHYINSILVKFFILFCFSPNIVALIIYISSLLD